MRQTLHSGNPDFPIFNGSIHASPPGYNLSIRPHYMTLIKPLFGVFGDFNIKLIRSRDLRWVPIVDLSTVLSPVAINLPPILLTVGVAPLT